MAAVDSPGDPKNPRSFMLCHENENKTAAYLGFTMVTQLRHFVVSWPCLRAYTAYSKIAKNLSLDGAMIHLRGHQNFSGIADPEKAFPFMQNDTEMAKKTVRSKRLAAILRRMQEEIIVLPNLLPGENTTRQADAITQFNATATGFDKFATIEPMELIMPKLHHEAGGEHDLEAASRCWVMLRYMRYAMQGKDFEKKFSEPAISRKTTVKLEHTPTWMRPKKATPAGPLRKSDAVARADDLSKKAFTLRLDPRIDVPDIQDDLQLRYTDDSVSTEAVPNTEQSFTIDPRLFESSPALRDQIRRQFKCNVYHTNINQCVIEYTLRTEDDSTLKMRANFDDSRTWLLWLNLFSAEAHNNFVFRIGLTLMNEEDNPFEECSIPPYVRDLLTRAEDGAEVVINDASLERKTDLASGEATGEEAGS